MKARRWPMVMIFLAVAVAAAGPLSAGPPLIPPGLEQAVAAQEAHTDALLARPGVVGTAVGLGADGRPVVKVYTRSGRVGGLPHALDGVPVEVEVTGDLVAQTHARGTWKRPVPTGVSIGSERLIVRGGLLYCTVGTLGARVIDGQGARYILSNAHVLALEGSQPYGAVQEGSSTGDRILQPGRVDMPGCGTASQIDAAVIGHLADYTPIELSRKASNTVDAAIAFTDVSLVGTATPAGYTPGSGPVTAALGMPVKKFGRTTDLTRGKVTGLNATVVIRYDKGQARFVNQIVVQGAGGAFSAAGDSGSLIVTDDANNAPVALLFAGSSSTTIGNPIQAVLDAFGVEIDGN